MEEEVRLTFSFASGGALVGHGDLGDHEFDQDPGIFVVVFLEVTIVVVVLGVVEKSDPLLVPVVLLRFFIDEVVLQMKTDGAVELVVGLVLDNDTDDFLRLGVLEGDLHHVRVVHIAQVDELHVAVDVEAHIFFVVFVVGALFEHDVVHLHVQLVAPRELSGLSYSNKKSQNH